MASIKTDFELELNWLGQSCTNNHKKIAGLILTKSQLLLMLLIGGELISLRLKAGFH